MRCLFGAALVALACAPFSAWAAEADPAVVGRAIDGFVRPAYAAFHETTGALDKAAKTLCAAPDAAGLDAARTAFDATVAAWSRVEIVRLAEQFKQAGARVLGITNDADSNLSKISDLAIDLRSGINGRGEPGRRAAS